MTLLGLSASHPEHPALAGAISDFYSFDPAARAGARLDGVVDGDAPIGRWRFGFASEGGRIFVFGGVTSRGPPATPIHLHHRDCSLDKVAEKLCA